MTGWAREATEIESFQVVTPCLEQGEAGMPTARVETENQQVSRPGTSSSTELRRQHFGVDVEVGPDVLHIFLILQSLEET